MYMYTLTQYILYIIYYSKYDMCVYSILQCSAAPVAAPPARFAFA